MRQGWFHNININPNQAAPQFTQQQTNAASNYQRAMADYESNPRMTGKQFQRGGFSSSAGTDYAGAADAANAYAKNMAGAQAVRMGDAYSNAGVELDDQIRNSQFGNALARLNEGRMQGQAMDQYQTVGNMTGFMGDIFQNMAGGFGGYRNKLVDSVLSGLL